MWYPLRHLYFVISIVLAVEMIDSSKRMHSYLDILDGFCFEKETWGRHIFEKPYKENEIMGLGNKIKGIMPSTRRFVNRRFDEQSSAICEIANHQKTIFENIQDVKKHDDVILSKIAQVEKKLAELDKIHTEIKKISNYGENIERQIAHAESLTIQKLDTETKAIQDCADINQREIRETVFANVFHDSIKSATWLQDSAFNPGRWALGYPAMYVLFRVLDENHPKSILELGLGQSTKMTTQYADSNNSICHYVYEHDLDWISFFRNKVKISAHTTVVNKTLSVKSYKDDERVNCYKDLDEVKDKKFDLFIIDAPIGGRQANIYSRMDVLDLVPQCLEKSFVIIVDDYHRVGEKRMVVELEEKLSANDIKYDKGIYSGEKDTLVLTSEDNQWICTM